MDTETRRKTGLLWVSKQVRFSFYNMIPKTVQKSIGKISAQKKKIDNNRVLTFRALGFRRSKFGTVF